MYLLIRICVCPVSRHVCWLICLLVLIDLFTYTYLCVSLLRSFSCCILRDRVSFLCSHWFVYLCSLICLPMLISWFTYTYLCVTFEKFLLLHFSVTGYRLFVLIDLFNCADWFIDWCWSTYLFMCICVSLSRRITCCTSPWKGVIDLCGLFSYLCVFVCITFKKYLRLHLTVHRDKVPFIVTISAT